MLHEVFEISNQNGVCRIMDGEREITLSPGDRLAVEINENWINFRLKGQDE